MTRHSLALAALLLAGSAPGARALAPAPAQTFTDPAEAGPDFAVQGEYAGQVGDRKLGVQVIALGSGTFQAVFLPGGFPGDGWDGKTRVRVEGKTAGETTAFQAPNGWSARIEGGQLAGQTDQGEKFRLARVTRQSPTLGMKPPSGAALLFDGTSAGAWAGGKVTADGLLEAGPRTQQSYRDFTMHLEFRTPFKPAARGQSRGNSGVYIQGLYELQILDSFGLDGVQNECGALYRQKAPAVNMCLPPLTWQTYDIEFQSARAENGQKVKNAVITLRHNGVAVLDHVEISGPTGGAAKKPEAGAPAPISLQNHGNPVRFRNIWIVDNK